MTALVVGGRRYPLASSPPPELVAEAQAALDVINAATDDLAVALRAIVRVVLRPEDVPVLLDEFDAAPGETGLLLAGYFLPPVGESGA